MMMTIITTIALSTKNVWACIRRYNDYILHTLSNETARGFWIHDDIAHIMYKCDYIYIFIYWCSYLFLCLYIYIYVCTSLYNIYICTFWLLTLAINTKNYVGVWSTIMIIILIVILIKKLAITNIPIHDDHNHNPDNIVNGDSYHDMSTNDKKHHNTNSITIITYRYNWIYIYIDMYIYILYIYICRQYIYIIYICIYV